MESAARQLQAKFDVARELFGAAPAAGADPSLAEALGRELAAEELRFALAAAPLFVAAAGGEAARLGALAAFSRLLAAEDFSGAVDALVGRAEAALRAAGAPLAPDDAPARARGRPRGRPGPPAAACAEVRRLLGLFPRAAARRARGEAFPAEGGTPRVDYEACPVCGVPMGVDPGRSVLRCEECGALRELVGTVFDDAQFYSQEGQKAKSGAFNPNRHFRYWWTHILALEPEEELGDRADPDNLVGEKVLARLRALVARDRKLLRLLTVGDVRLMLREVGRTALNANVALLLKKLTGVGPPLLDEAVAIRAENLFKKAIEVGARLRGEGNRKYYPFYIFKILDLILADPADRRVLYYIYIQGKDTVEADDREWELICRELPEELSYTPTDVSLGLAYRPV